MVGNLCSLPVFLQFVQLHGVGRLFLFRHAGHHNGRSLWSGGARSRRLR
jgi:hypothetical protein